MFVFIDEVPVISHNFKQDCDVFSVGDEFQSFEYAFGLAKESPYSSLIDAYILKYREQGYMDELWAKWSSVNQVCSTGVGKTQTLDLSMLTGIFYVLGGGVGVSVLLGVVEVVYAAVLDARRDKDLRFITALVNRVMRRTGRGGEGKVNGEGGRVTANGMAGMRKSENI